MPKPQPRHQSRLNDIQMLQQHMMFKQLQEQQRLQQFQELDDGRQQNHINQQSMVNKQVSGDQFPTLINGTPIHDVSQRFMVNNMNLVHHGASPLVQGFSNGMGFPQAQSQALRTMGLVSPQLDASIYGTPVASAGNNLGPYSHLRGESHDSVNVFAKGNNNQEEKPIMQSSPFSKSLRNNQCDDYFNQVCMQMGDFVSRQEFQGKNLFGKVPTHGTNSEALAGNFQQVNTGQRHKSVMELGGRQEQAGLPDLFPAKMTNGGPSQGLCSLDPLEQKILFNMDDNSWEASFGRHSNTSTGGFGNTTEGTENTNAFPSIQSGSWSALMQSAVAEASSSDNGLQEEWSGLSFQNTEISTDNQPLNFMDSEKPQFNCVDNNLQCTSSLSSKPELQFNNSNMSSSFPGFQQSGIQFSLKQKQGMPSESSHESNQQSPKNNNKWLDCNPQQKQTIEVSQPIQILLPLQSAWLGHDNEHSESNAHQRSISPYTNRFEADNIAGVAYGESHNLWKAHDNHVEGSIFNSFGRLDHVKSSHFNTGRHVVESHQVGYMKDADVSVQDERIENMGYNQHNQSNSPQICMNSYKGPSGTYEKQECFQRECSTDSYHSNASQYTIIGHELRNNAWLHKSDARHMAEGNQKPSGQVLCKQIPQGPNGNKLGNAEQFKFNGNVSGSGMDLEKGHLPDVQRNLTEEVPARNNVGSNISAFFESASDFHGPSVTAQTSSQNMLELLHKVDNSKDYRLGMNFGSKDSTSFPDVPQVENPYASAARPYNNKPSPSQCFGLRLSPPFERLPFSNCFDSPQSSPKTGNSRGAVSFGPSHVRNQLQNQQQLTASVACQSQEAILPGLGSSQDASLRNSTNPHGQQLPISEANQVSQPFATSGMSQQGGFSMGLPNRWTTVPTQRNLSGTEPHKVPFTLPPSPNATSSSHETASTAPQELCNETYFKGGNEAGARSLNSEGFGFQGEHDKKETPVQQISSRTFDPVSHKGKLSYEQVSVAKTLLETNAVTAGSLMTDSYQQGFDWAQHSDNQSQKISDIEVFGRSLKPSHVPSQNYSLLHQMHSVRNVQNDPSKRLLAKYNGVDSDLNVQHETANTGQQLYEHSSGVRNVVNNGLIQELMSDSRAAHQFSPGKPFENLYMNSSIVQLNSSGAGQESSGWPTTTASTLVAVKRLSTPYMLPPDVSAQNLAVLRPKKRKIAAFEILPWHKEVTQGPRRLLDISLSGLVWAQAANRLIEKVDETATNEDASILRPKKRLILTTQLMQHLFRPAPAVILSGDAASNCYSVVYFAARLAVGDACCLSRSPRMPCDISDMSSEKCKTPKRSGGQEITEVVEDFINRVKKLEADFLILDKCASISDLRVESRELEKFSVINRFAKYHIRGQAGTAEASTSSVAMRAIPQRYVTAAPMPRTVPEGAQCLSI